MLTSFIAFKNIVLTDQTYYENNEAVFYYRQENLTKDTDIFNWEELFYADVICGPIRVDFSNRIAYVVKGLDKEDYLEEVEDNDYGMEKDEDEEPKDEEEKSEKDKKPVNLDSINMTFDSYLDQEGE